MSKQQKSQLIKIILGVLGFFFLIGLWALISFLLYQKGNRLLPYPHEVLAKLNAILFEKDYAQTTWVAMGWSLLRLLIGFIVSFLFGGILGTLGGLFAKFAAFMAPYVSFSKTMPTAAFVLILVGIFYSYRGLAPYIPCFLVFMVAFPVIYEAFKNGIASESQDTKDALDLDCGRHSWAAIHDVLWPDSQNYIALSIVQSLGLSMKVSVMSEILTNSSTSKGGLGGLIQNASLNASMADVLAYSLLAVIVILLIDIPLFILKKQLKVGLE
jgi:NitT/TauT family transport system permease protein